MSFKCLVVFSLIAIAHSSVIKRHIPVEVVYDRSSLAHYGTRNLDEKVQLSPDQLKINNELLNPESEQPLVKSISGSSNFGLKPEAIGENSGGLRGVFQLPFQNENFRKRLEKAILSSVNQIRDNANKAGQVVSEERWEGLNKNIEIFLNDQYKSLKQSAPDNQNQNVGQFFQNLGNGLQAIFNNFVQNNNNTSGSGSNGNPEDEQQNASQGPVQGFVNFISGGFNQLSQSIGNIGNGGQNPQGTGQEDTGTEGGNPFQNFFNSFTQFFQGGGGNGGAGTQGDTGVEPSTNAPNIVQNIVNSISQVFNNNNNRPTSTPTTTVVQADEEASQAPSSTQAPNFIQSIGQAVQNVNLVGNEGSNSSSQGSTNPISIAGNQFSQLVGSQTGSNPLVSAVSGQIPPNPIANISESFVNQAQNFGQSGGNGSNAIQSGIQSIGGQVSQGIQQGIDQGNQLGSQIPNGGDFINQGQAFIGNNSVPGLQNPFASSTTSTETPTVNASKI